MWLSAATPLTRLRLAFLALGAALLLLIAGLLHSALLRLAHQRSLRHAMVAERVFDEVEREISSVLQHEADRPSSAYDPADTDPGNWSPFVVGYYRRDPDLQLIAQGRLDAARAARLRSALEQPLSWSGGEPTGEGGGVNGGPRSSQARATAHTTSSPEVLRQLNRGVKVRERRQRDFLTHFSVAHAGPLLVGERRASETERSEGLVIDVPQLVRTIESWVLGSQGLRRVAALSMTAGPAASGRGSSSTVRHRLAAPFEPYEISLRLAPLDDEDAAGTLYGFAALFALAAALGLYSICRVVEVQVAFAERRNNFVAAVTHELRTPLTSIRMYGEMLRDGMVEDDTTRHEYHGIITAEAERLTRLINNVMEHARLRRGQRYAHLELGDVGGLVRDVVELMRPHIEREGFALALDVAAKLAPVHFDADALKQILFNVLDNALKYGRGQGTSRIDITCEPAPDAGVLVAVRDYGPGVPDAQLNAIFEPFLRGQSELTRRQQGTGLGLAIVRDLAALMHGQVQAVNRSPGLELQLRLAPGTR